MTAILLSNTLEGLESGDLRTFQRHLCQPEQGFAPFRRAQLEDVDAAKTADLMADKFCEEAVDVAVQILRKMDKNKLAKELEDGRRGPATKVTTTTSSTSSTFSSSSPVPPTQITNSAHGGGICFSPHIASNSMGGAVTMNVHINTRPPP